MKTLKRILKQDKERFNVPSGIQHTIPVRKIWNDGIFLSEKNKYSKCYKFTDINYAVASKEDKELMFLNYSELLNSFDTNATTKITVLNRKLNKLDFENNILLKYKEDGLDIYRKEYNDMLLEKSVNSNGIIQEKFITVSINKKNIEEAKNYFSRMTTDLTSHFQQLGAKCVELNATERLRLIHDFYRKGEEEDFYFDILDNLKKGHSFKDYVCPDSIQFYDDYIKIGDRYARVLYLKEYANYIRDDIVMELTDINRNMMLSIDVIPIPMDEAIKEVENRRLGVETNITNWQRRQNNNNNFSAVIPYDLELQRKESKEFLEDLTTRDQRMFVCVLTLVHTADTKEQLDSDTESLRTVARKKLCQLSTLKYQQLDGLNTVFPYGVRKINSLRTLTTESLATFIPFKVQEIQDRGGIYYGLNAISRNLIMINKSNLLNQSSFLLGVPGSGKSFSAKELIVFLTLSTEDDILICDPENEYSALVDALGGEVIHISSSSKDHINAMDMTEGYGEGLNPIADKSEFILSLFEQLDKKGLGAKQKSIIDRCTSLVYSECEKNNEIPTLIKLREKLLEQPEKEAGELALSLELFTNGSLNIFAHKTNVDTNNRIISYDIYNLGKQLKAMGLLVITDALINRVADNYKKGKRTHIFIDEIHVLFENEYSATFFNSAWRQFRKRNAYPTAITQNVESLLASVESRTMLSNSEFIVMLNQATSDREKLADLLSISDEQLSYITNSEAGCGLIRYGSLLVPFINEFPKDTKLYKLMTTKPGE
ncbi:MAG: ATP-binding protein [Bacilli bacterium]|nr:ATP-binding protein [Bacilli bacterium]